MPALTAMVVVGQLSPPRSLAGEVVGVGPANAGREGV